MKIKRNIWLMLMLLVAVVMQAQKTYIICVGINNYDNGDRPLPCSRGDVKGLAAFFDKYKDSDIHMLLDKNATRSNILKVIKKQCNKAKAGDEIIFAYSGHGFDGGVSCYDTRNAVYCGEIQEIMAKSKAKRKVIFINSCHSGSFSKQFKDKFNGSYKNSNIMMFMSSRSNESSWESSGMYMSFFFDRLIEGLRGSADANNDSKVTARELFNYVSPRVAQDTEGIQHPQMFGQFSDNMVIVNTKSIIE